MPEIDETFNSLFEMMQLQIDIMEAEAGYPRSRVGLDEERTIEAEFIGPSQEEAEAEVQEVVDDLRGVGAEARYEVVGQSDWDDEVYRINILIGQGDD